MKTGTGLATPHERPTRRERKASDAGDTFTTGHEARVWSMTIMAARKWTIALLVAMATSACSKASDQKQGDVFRSCYDRCMAPPKGQCQPEHETCLVLCRDGRDPMARVMPHLRSRDEPEISGRSRLSHSVRIETIGGVATPLIDKCVQLPFEATEVFSTAMDNQRTVNAHLVAGEFEKVDE